MAYNASLVMLTNKMAQRQLDEEAWAAVVATTLKQPPDKCSRSVNTYIWLCEVANQG